MMSGFIKKGFLLGITMGITAFGMMMASNAMAEGPSYHGQGKEHMSDEAKEMLDKHKHKHKHKDKGQEMREKHKEKHGDKMKNSYKKGEGKGEALKHKYKKKKY